MGRSLQARLVALYLKKANPRKTDEEVIAEFEAAKAQPAPVYEIPESVKLASPVEARDFSGMRYYVVNDAADPAKVVFYVHGGAYRHEIEPAHWKLIDTVAQETGATVVVPLYPLLQHSDCLAAIDLITGLWEQYLSTPELILMGDSSGGGLGLGLELDWAKKDIRLPDKTILISPWVDIRVCNPDDEALQKTDPFLSVPTLRVCGEWWRGELPADDYRVSPLLGDTSALKNVTIFTGTREVLYPDTVLFYEKIKGLRNCKLIVAEGMNHVYPLLGLPESKPAVSRMIKEIMR